MSSTLFVLVTGIDLKLLNHPVMTPIYPGLYEDVGIWSHFDMFVRLPPRSTLASGLFWCRLNILNIYIHCSFCLLLHFQFWFDCKAFLQFPLSSHSFLMDPPNTILNSKALSAISGSSISLNFYKWKRTLVNK